jgi:hypothetical protein
MAAHFDPTATVPRSSTYNYSSLPSEYVPGKQLNSGVSGLTNPSFMSTATALPSYPSNHNRSQPPQPDQDTQVHRQKVLRFYDKIRSVFVKYKELVSRDISALPPTDQQTEASEIGLLLSELRDFKAKLCDEYKLGGPFASRTPLNPKMRAVVQEIKAKLLSIHSLMDKNLALQRQAVRQLLEDDLDIHALERRVQRYRKRVVAMRQLSHNLQQRGELQAKLRHLPYLHVQRAGPDWQKWSFDEASIFQ